MSSRDQIQPEKTPKLLDQVCEAVRRLHYSIRTEAAYVQRIKRFILFHGKRHPLEMGEREVEAFLNHLAIEGNSAASTQNQAMRIDVWTPRPQDRTEVIRSR